MDTTHIKGGNGFSLMAFGYIEVVASVICCALRAYGARTNGGRWRWDFIWVLLATTLGVAALVPAQLAVKEGLANHLAIIGWPQAVKAMRYFWIAIYLGLPAMCFAKFSIIALLLSVQGPNATKRAIALYILAVLMFITSMVEIPLIVFSCNPRGKLEDLFMPGDCDIQKRATIPFGILQGSMSAFVDVVLALWPISIVWNLNTSMRVKVGFCGLMAVGILPAVASVIRTTMIEELPTNLDVTYTLGTFLFWASAECMAVIVLGSIPPLRPLFLRVFYGVKSTVASSHRGSRLTGPQSYGGNDGRMMTNLDGGKDAGIHLNTARVFDDSSSDHGEPGRKIFVTREVNVEKVGRGGRGPQQHV